MMRLYTLFISTRAFNKKENTADIMWLTYRPVRRRTARERITSMLSAAVVGSLPPVAKEIAASFLLIMCAARLLYISLIQSYLYTAVLRWACV